MAQAEKREANLPTTTTARGVTSRPCRVLDAMDAAAMDAIICVSFIYRALELCKDTNTERGLVMEAKGSSMPDFWVS